MKEISLDAEGHKPLQRIVKIRVFEVNGSMGVPVEPLIFWAGRNATFDVLLRKVIHIINPALLAKTKRAGLMILPFRLDCVQLDRIETNFKSSL